MAKYEAKSDVTGAIWKITTAVGDTVAEGDTIMIVESMKMEIPVIAEEGGRIGEFRVKEGDPVNEGDVVVLIETS
ncbi:MAG: biotin/lipoyl-binding carrier protein [Variibacter sp.]